MAAPTAKFPKKEKVILTPLQLLEQTRKDSVTRHDKYQEKLRVNHRSLVKRISHAVQEITNKGAFILRIPDAQLGIRTLTFNQRGFIMTAVNDKGVTVSLSDQSHDYLLHLAKLLAENKYALLANGDEDTFKSYMANIFPEQDAAYTERQAEREAIVKEQDGFVDAVRKTFLRELTDMLRKLKSLGLGLRLQPISGSYNSGDLNFLTVSGKTLESLTLSGSGNGSVDGGAYLTEIRKQLRAGTITIVPCDYQF